LNDQTLALPLHLPLSTASFVTPQTCDSPGFFSNWNALVGGGKDIQVIFKARDLTALQKPSLDHALVSVRLASLSGVDPNPANAVGSGTVNLKESSIGVFVRLEANTRDGLIRASVRTSNAAASQSVQSLIQSQLSVPDS